MDTNQRRAQRGYEAIQSHPDYPFGVDFFTAASDVIADVLHAVARLDGLNRELFGDEAPSFDAQALVDRAVRTFRGDREDEADEYPDPPEDLADAWRRYQAGEDVLASELRALDEWRADVNEERSNA